MTVLLMADLTQMAWQSRKAGLSFSPVALLDAFLSATGPQGTLLVPTYNFDLRDGERYDPARTPPITGALAKAALAHPAFRRSRHPLHSFAVAGGGAASYLHAEDSSSFGAASVFALLHQARAIQVVLDLPLNKALTYVHHVEELERVPYRRWRTLHLTLPREQGGQQVRAFRRFQKRNGHSNDLHALAPLLQQAGVMQQLMVHGSKALVIDLSAAHELIATDIRLNSARSIHRFSWGLWARDLLRPIIKRGPSLSARSLENHVAD